MEKNNETWAFFYQVINLWNTSIRYPGWMLATKKEIKNIIKNAYDDGFKIKIEKSYKVEETIAEALYMLKRFVQTANDEQNREYLKRKRK